MKPKLSSKTPDAIESSALIEYHEQIKDEFHAPHGKTSYLAIVELSVPAILDRADGDFQANMVIQHVELAIAGTDEEKVEALFTKLWQQRTKASGPRPHPGEEGVPDTPLEGIDDSIE